MKIKTAVKKSRLLSPVYQKARKMKKERELDNQFRYSGTFINRSEGSRYLCIVLAGYKEFLYPAVFGRIRKFMDQRLDVCVITSGLYSADIDEICRQNSWSYLSTKENNVSLVQNVAIKLHPNARYIFKLDEDIFITENYFTRLLEAYYETENGEYHPGVMAPIIPVNGYGHMRVLEKLGLQETYKRKFQEPKYMAGYERMIESRPETAKFFWGEGGMVPSIDEMNRMFWNMKHEARPCPVRFSIGAILFERSLWESMKYFKVNRKITGLGDDEEELCAFCCLNSRPIMVSENIVVGHLGFGPQNRAMKEYYEQNPERFACW